MKRLQERELIGGLDYQFGTPMSPDLHSLDVQRDRKRRVQLRAITVDIVRSNTLDDSITVERLENGQFRLIYNIVDIVDDIQRPNWIFEELLFRFKKFNYFDQNNKEKVNFLFPRDFVNQVSFNKINSNKKRAISFVFNFDEEGNMIVFEPVDAFFSEVVVEDNFYAGNIGTYTNASLSDNALNFRQLLNIGYGDTADEVKAKEAELFFRLRVAVSNYMRQLVCLGENALAGDLSAPILIKDCGITPIKYAGLISRKYEIARNSRLYVPSRDDERVQHSLNAPLRRVTDLINGMIFSDILQSRESEFDFGYLRLIASYINDRVIRSSEIIYPRRTNSNVPVLENDKK